MFIIINEFNLACKLIITLFGIFIQISKYFQHKVNYFYFLT